MERRRITVSAVIAGLAMASTMGISRAADPPEPANPAGVADTVVLDGMAVSYSIPDYKCDPQAKCPEDLLLLDVNGNHQGCVPAGGSCTGNCYSCEGSEGPFNACIPKEGQTCVGNDPTRLFTCGRIRVHNVNACSTNPIPGVPPPPNGCYRDVTLGFYTEIKPCEVYECNG